MANNHHFGSKHSYFGADTKGHDLKVFGDTTGKYFEWDASANQLNIVGAVAQTGNSAITGTLDVSSDFKVNTDDFVVDVDGDITLAPTGGTVAVTGQLDLDATASAASGAYGVGAWVTAATGVGVTGTLRGGYFVATNGDTASSGAVRGIEVKARAADGDGVGNTVALLQAGYFSADAKAKEATTLRGIEVSIDGEAGGSSTTVQGVVVFNNSSATQAAAYALDINGGTASGHSPFTADIRLQNGETISNATDGVIALSGIAEVATLQAVSGGHLVINTQDSDKNVRINSQTFTEDASIVAVQIKPAAGVDLTSGIVGLEVEPRVNDTFDGTSIHAIYAAPWKRGAGAAGDLSGDFLAIEGKLQSDSGYTGTIAGPAAILRAVNSLHGTVTTGPVVIYANQHEGNVAWTAFLEGAEALGTHSLTTASDKTGNAKAGTLKVRFNDTLYHIQLYADS